MKYSNLSVGHNYFYWQINSEGETTTFEAKISYDTIKPYAGQNAIIDFFNYELEANDGNISPGKSEDKNIVNHRLCRYRRCYSQFEPYESKDRA